MQRGTVVVSLNKLRNLLKGLVLICIHNALQREVSQAQAVRVSTVAHQQEVAFYATGCRHHCRKNCREHLQLMETGTAQRPRLQKHRTRLGLQLRPQRGLLGCNTYQVLVLLAYLLQHLWLESRSQLRLFAGNQSNKVHH